MNPQPSTHFRSDSGQFWSDFPQPLWRLQPNEPAADYQLFAAWLQLPAPRPFRKAAPTLGCSLHRLRQLSARHHWKTRAAAFDQHRANAASVALEQLLDEETLDWQHRAQRFRHQEWLLCEEMLRAARQLLQQVQNDPDSVSFRNMLALFESASALARRALGLPLKPTAVPATESKPPSCHLDFQAALQKIYGQPPTAGDSS